jgi:hypothetical protein
VEGVLGLGNLLPGCERTNSDSPRLTPNTQRRAPEIGWLQATMSLDESLLRRGVAGFRNSYPSGSTFRYSSYATKRIASECAVIRQ